MISTTTLVALLTSVTFSAAVSWVYTGWRLRQLRETDPEMYRRVIQ